MLKHNFFSLFQKKLSIRQYITYPFILFFGLTVLFFIIIGYLSAYNSAYSYARLLSQETNRQIIARLDQYFTNVASITLTNKELIKIGSLDVRNKKAVEQQFMTQLKNNPYVTYISFGDPMGEYIGASRTPGSDEICFMSSRKLLNKTLDTYSVEDDNTIGEKLYTGVAFDVTIRPWYLYAVNHEDPSWYPAYKYAVFDSLGMGITTPIYDKQKKLIGVVTSDISSVHISNFLKTLQLGKNGFAFIAQPDRKLIATTLHPKVFTMHGDKMLQYDFKNYPDHRFYFIEPFFDRNGQGTTMTVDGKEYLVQLTDYKNQYGLSLTIGVVLAAEDHMPQWLQGVAWLVAITVGFAIVLGIFLVKLSRKLANPIEVLTMHANAITNGELNTFIVPTERIEEIDQLGASFNTMSIRLRDSFASLEFKIAERTIQLQEANDKLKELSITDGLTHLFNRRYFDEALVKSWEYSQRTDTPISLIMTDIDYFKQYNDYYGHQAGDECLVQVSKLLQENTKRLNDVVARYGGEEFVILMPGADPSDALNIAHNMCREVEALEIVYKGSSNNKITASFGVATLIASRDKSPEYLIGLADAALYEAKNQGRNRVVFKADV